MTLRAVLFQAFNRNSGILKHQLESARVLYVHQQSRSKGSTQYKFGRPWHVKKVNQSINDENLTTENEEFIKEVIHETYTQHPSPLREEPWQRGEYLKFTRRCGVIGIKLGLVPQWTKTGEKITTTLVQILDNHVIRYTPPEEAAKTAGWHPLWRKFGSVVVGALSSDPRQFKKSYNSLFAEAGVPPKQKLTRFLVTPNAAIQPGTPLTAMHFRVGDYVDVQAKTIDYGFQGVIKRWGMKGMPASHGVTKSHRKMGSSGGGREKAGIWKGKKMPGHMGDRNRITKGIRIWRINTKYNVLYLHGPSVPGSIHTYVRIYDTILPHKRPNPDDHPPMPTWFEEDSEGQCPEEQWDEELFAFTEPSVEYQ
ncbi:hypothetical protein C0Q70_18528 [Pomacea canaliculata]|uniref:Large ribosomal subunit protein uL3m n=2 Tax=Pomacea canaliculata TaxID=400727 RepID=A0A2T7NGS1_POMCA|nr:hypothetical protein C0Q70_18528 [Pomacea canaliculata]